MARRRNPYDVPLASEWEANLFLRFFVGLVVAIFGVIYLLFTLTQESQTKERSNEDLLAPRRLKSVFRLVCEQILNDIFGWITDPKDAFRWSLILFRISISQVFLTFLKNPISALLRFLRVVINQLFKLLWRIIVLWLCADIVFSIVGFLFLGDYPRLVLFSEYTLIEIRPLIFLFVILSLGYSLHVSYFLREGSHDFSTLFHHGEKLLYNKEKMNTTYTIRVPRGLEWNAERSTRFIEQLLYSFEPLLFRICADDQNILWQIVDPLGREPDMIEYSIRVLYPEAQVKIVKAYDPPTSTVYRLTLVYESLNEYVGPLKHAKSVKDFDPLSAVVSAMNRLKSGERVSFNLFVVGMHPTANETGVKYITNSTIRFTDYLSLSGLRKIRDLKYAGAERVERFVGRDQKVLEDKLRAPLYQAVYMLQVDSPTIERIFTLAEMVDSQMFGFADLPYNALQTHKRIKEENESQISSALKQDIVTLNSGGNALSGSAIDQIWKYAESHAYAAERWDTRLILGSQEMALLWHLPDDRFTASRVKWLSSRTVTPPTTVTISPSGTYLLLGRGTSGGEVFPVCLPLKDRENHVRIIGKTGVGKSSLLQNYIMQDLEDGFGVTVIDPHGSLIEDILKHCVPGHRHRDVIVLDLADTTHPPPLNPLRGGLSHVQVGQIVKSIEQLFPATRQYPRVSHFLRTALLTLNADKQATIRDIVRLFMDPDYRNSLLPHVEADIQQTWKEYSDMRAGEQRAIAEPIRNRISPFYTNPDLTPIMCHPDSIDFGAYIKARKVLLVSLKMDESRVPETERNLIGALLISRLQVSGMQTRSEAPHFVYIDEVQRFVTSSLDEMFSEARKFGLSLTVAHQYIDQLSDATQSALIGNVGATIIFACGPTDAKTFIPYTQPHFDIDDIVSLDQFTSIARIQYDGVTQPAFTLLTPLPRGLTTQDTTERRVFAQRLELDPQAIGSPVNKYPNLPTIERRKVRSVPSQILSEIIRGNSYQNYTPKTMEEVLAWLHKRYGRSITIDDQRLHTELEPNQTSTTDIPTEQPQRPQDSQSDDRPLSSSDSSAIADLGEGAADNQNQFTEPLDTDASSDDEPPDSDHDDKTEN